MSALDRYPEYNAFRNRGTLEDQPAPDESAGPAVWMIRAGRGGQYAPIFVARSAASVGWGATGDIHGLSRDELLERVKTAFPKYGKGQLGSTVSLLARFSRTMADGDLVVTPEPATRTILFGRIAGDYAFLSEPIETDTDHQHLRQVRWFARISRDELSYGARNSLGSLMTLTQPAHAGELLQLADAHANDPPPAPIEQRTSRRPGSGPCRRAGHRASPRRPSRRASLRTSSRRILVAWSRCSTTSTGASLRSQIPAQLRLGTRCHPRAPRLDHPVVPGGSALFPARRRRCLQSTAGRGSATLTRPLELVLDGQQRLTSLYQALFGVGASILPRHRRADRGRDVNDAVRVFSAERARPLETLERRPTRLMMPLVTVRGSGASHWRDEVVELRDARTTGTRSILLQVERSYIQPLADYAFPSLCSHARPSSRRSAPSSRR